MELPTDILLRIAGELGPVEFHSLRQTRMRDLLPPRGQAETIVAMLLNTQRYRDLAIQVEFASGPSDSIRFYPRNGQRFDGKSSRPYPHREYPRRLTLQQAIDFVLSREKAVKSVSFYRVRVNRQRPNCPVTKTVGRALVKVLL